MAIVLIESISAVLPYKCTAIIALVFFVIFSSILSTSILNVSITGSTNRGLAPTYVIAKAVAIYVLEGTITSSPTPISIALKIKINESKPEATPTQYLTPQ